MSARARRVRFWRTASIASAALGLLSCSETPRAGAAWQQEAGYRWRELAVRTRGVAGFEQLDASRTGLTHRNEIDMERGLSNRGLLNGAGVALGDVDADGRPDVVLASLERPAALYRNDGDFRFTDVTTASGLDFTGLATTSVVLADIDGDGDLDLVAGTLGGPVLLFTNDGRGHFTNSTSASGLTGGYYATTMTLADVDGNGSLDLYVATYKVRNALDAFTPQQRSFDQVLKTVGDSVVVDPEWTTEYRVEARPDLGGFMRSQRAEPDLFFLNDGRGHFTAVSVRGERFRDEQGRPLAEVPDYFGLAARFYDVNGDGAPDLYVCNDLEDPDLFWLNDGRGNFRFAPQGALRATSNTCMSVDMADVNRDGHVDMFTADMLAPSLAAQQRSIPTHTPLQKRVGLSPERTQWMRNMLQVSRGDGTWAQVADFAGVTATDWTWGSAFLDVDLDGFEDLLAVNGHRYDVREADPYDRIRNSFPRVPWNRESAEFPPLRTRSVAFRNNGDLTFTDRSRDWGWGVDTAISHGIAFADLDGDGALDVVVTRLDAPSVVYRNRSSAPRVTVRLRGAGANTQGIGAVVTVRSGSLPAQSREMTSGGYYLSGSDAQLTFAAASDSSTVIDVRWRSGRSSVIRGARSNRLYEVDEAGAVMAAQPADSVTPLFADASALLRGAAHADELYADFRRQPLLPSRLSQLGPGVSWIDVDGDGAEDLVFGAGRGGRLTVLRNSGGRFTPLSVAGPTQQLDLTTVLPIPGPRGGVVLVAGQSNYEAADLDAALTAPSLLGFGAGSRIAAPLPLLAGDSAGIGALTMADVNGDGYVDLFIGARVVPGAWPLPARSRVLLGNRDGSFAEDESNRRVMAALGLVTSAIFADLEGDGLPELIVATEFGPVRVLHNDAGRFVDVTKAMGVSSMSSRWNGVTAADLDGDGRLDLVVTSWGRNTPWKTSRARPYTLVISRLEENRLGLIFARADSATGREMPLDGFSRIGAALPSVRERFATFAAFAEADADALLGPAATSAERVGATTFDHMLFLNRGDHFEARSLPAAAQLAPSSGAVAADFNGDGHVDLFLAQNFFPTEINTMRFDAGVGLLLLGDGTGNLQPQSVRSAGIAVHGDMRGAAAADYDGDGRVDLAVSQNGAPMTLWRNVGATPGMRLTLRGGAGNPLAIGARIRVVANGAAGAAHEVQAGNGHWSMNASTLVLALPVGATAVRVRWPGGAEQEVPITPLQRALTLTVPDAR